MHKVFSEGLGLAVFTGEQVGFVVLPHAGDFLLHFHLLRKSRKGIALTSN